jgi:hypothetical protein
MNTPIDRMAVPFLSGILPKAPYLPTITTWNRLEGRARAEDFDRAMKAEVRDALWMLSKQWQMGEFIGDDAGSPVLARAHLETTSLTRYRGGDGPVIPLEQDVPLEAKIETQRVPFRQGGLDIGLDLRLLMGRQWLKLVAGVDPALRARFIERYGIAPADPHDEADAAISAHPGVWQRVAAVAGRAMDGYALYHHLTADDSHRAYDGFATPPTAAQQTAIDDLAGRFIAWFDRLLYQPSGDNPSWRPDYLEHRFTCSAPRDGGERVMVAEAYHHGHLDWYNLDVSPDQGGLGVPDGGDPVGDTQGAITRSFIPTHVAFGGMPDSRWWAFEDHATELGFVRPDTTDLNKLMLLEFMLVFANDWFLVPFTVSTGSVADVRGLMVTNVFGEHTWVEAAGRGDDEHWQRWSMFTSSVHGSEDVPADTTLLVLPVARKVLEGKPVEEVLLLRDEIANMVWGVEARVPVATGSAIPGREAAYELTATLQRHLDATNPPDPEIPPAAPIRYRLVNTVPENWIPFVPVHVDADRREIQLQRAAMPRILRGDPRIPQKIEPRTSLLREGLDAVPARQYFIHEEEVPRAGIRVHKAFQRTRWYDGRVYTWLGIRKQVGRGEGSSGLAFDRVVPLDTGA